jgi:anti-sigma factor RsiW
MTPDRCNEGTLIGFLFGELDEADAARFDAHLLGCDPCWAAAVEDRRGQQAAGSLREAAPDAVRERLGRTLDVAVRGQHRRRRHRRFATVAIAVAAAVAAIGTQVAPRSGRTGDPAAVAAVVCLAGGGWPLPPDAGVVTVWQARSPSGGVVVAESQTAFPMPADARFTTVGSSRVWEARRGRLLLLCVMAPHAALLAGPVPEAELVSVARAYGLAG